MRNEILNNEIGIEQKPFDRLNIFESAISKIDFSQILKSIKFEDFNFDHQSEILSNAEFKEFLKSKFEENLSPDM